MPLYVVAGLLVAVLVVLSFAAFMLGLLGEIGLVRLARCTRCAHFVVTARGAVQTACPYCSHEHLAHPLRTMRHPFRELSHH